MPNALGAASNLPLSALLSQALVAFTIELDNEFERRMGESGYCDARLSQVVWLNLMRFLTKRGLPVRELARQAFASEASLKFELGCLERWRFITLRPDSEDRRPIPLRAHPQAQRELRDGWGSGRGIRTEWIVRLAAKGRKAAEIWPPIFGEIERRWEKRFGQKEIHRLRESLQSVAGQLDVELPLGLPANWDMAEQALFPLRTARGDARLPCPALLSQALLAFMMEFNRESAAPLALSANTLRVLGEKPVRVGEIPGLTGCSPEMSGPGWQLKPYIAVEPAPSPGRGKVVRLTPRGLEAQRKYDHLVREIEARWEGRFGQGRIRGLRESMQDLFKERAGRSLIAEGLIPPRGVARTGDQMPALGRRDVGAAARQRMRDLVEQTQAMVRDPAGSLPHYPLWDMNRGFGP